MFESTNSLIVNIYLNLTQKTKMRFFFSLFDIFAKFNSGPFMFDKFACQILDYKIGNVYIIEHLSY